MSRAAAATLLLVLFAAPATGRADGLPSVELGDEAELDLAGRLAWYPDPEGRLDADSARGLALSGAFRAPTPGAVLVRPAGGATWLAARLAGGAPIPRRLTLEQPLIDRFDAWLVDGGRADHWQGGLAVAPARRTARHLGAYHEAPLWLLEGAPALLLLRVEASRPYAADLRLWTPDGLVARDQGRGLTTGIEVGALLSLIGVLLVAWLVRRDLWSLWLAALVALFCAWLVAVSGAGARWLWPGSPRLAMALPPFLGTVLCGALLAFVTGLLGASGRLRRFGRLGWAGVWAAGVASLGVLAAPLAGLAWLSPLLALLVSTVSLTLVSVLVVAGARTLDRISWRPLASWLVVAIGGLAYVASVFGLLPGGAAAVAAFAAAVILSAAVVSVALSERIEAQRLGERLALERSLSESQESFRTAFMTSPEAISITRLTDGVYVQVNEGFERITGYPAAEIVGRRALDVGIWADTADRDRMVAALRATGRMDNLEAVFVGRDGHRTVGLMSAARIDLAGVPHILAVTRDVTDRRRAEAERDALAEQLRQSQKMEAIGRLAGGVAHDFNNLLTAITANVSVALLDLPAGDPMAEVFEEIQAAAERAGGLTRQLLALSRRQVLEPRPIDLGIQAAGMAAMLHRLLGEDVAVTIAADPATPVVMADPGQVEQVVLNLAVNSRDAMPGGGRLQIDVSPRRIDVPEAGGERKPGAYGVVSVRDDGQGIPPEILPHIFEPFFSTKGSKGTGLGLSTVYGIAVQHGGFIDVESNPGRGTTISVAFPAAPAGARPVVAPAVPEPVREGHGEMVLLVEDDPAVRLATFSMLQRIGYRVLEAGDGVAAEEVAAAFPGRIDLLLTDVVMPRRNGRETAARLAAVRPGLAVVFMSGYTQDVIDRAGVLETGLLLLRKPFTAAQLAESLQTALARR